MQRKPIFPAFPQTRALPWVLAGLAVLALIYGLITDAAGFEVLGGTVLAAVIVAYPLAHLLLGKPPALDDDGEPPDQP